MRQARFRLSEALDVLALGAALGELVVLEGLERDLESSRITRECSSRFFMLSHSFSKFHCSRSFTSSQIPRRRGDVGQDAVVPPLAEGPGAKAAGLDDVAFFGHDAVRVREPIVPQGSASEHPRPHVPVDVVLRAFRVLLEEHLFAEAAEGLVELPPP